MSPSEVSQPDAENEPAMDNESLYRGEETVQDDDLAGQTADAPENLSDDPEQLREELQQATDRILRLQAEMQNLRNRTSREITDIRRYACLPLLRDLLPALDNITRAIESAENAESADGLLEGFKLVKQQLLTALSQHHCKEIEAVGEPFDPNHHEAILQQPSGEHPAQTVTLVTQAGYRLHDRVVRASQVIVSTGPEKSVDQKESEK